MRRLLTYLVALFSMAATMGAAPAANTIPNVKSLVSPIPALVQSKPAKKILRKHSDRPYQVGTASWYGRQFHGRATASGEPFNMFNLTAAHRQLPLGTWIKVTNLRNGASVLVRVNDRGPVPKSRIIDLSYEAATLLDLRAYGIQKVRLDLVDPQTVALALNAQQLN